MVSIYFQFCMENNANIFFKINFWFLLVLLAEPAAARNLKLAVRKIIFVFSKFNFLFSKSYLCINRTICSESRTNEDTFKFIFSEFVQREKSNREMLASVEFCR